MKARRKGTNEPFMEIESVTFAGSTYVDDLYNVSVKDLEFEQEPHQLNPEEEKSRHFEIIRQQTVIAAMQGFIAHGWDDSECIVKRSIRVADALVKKLKGE